MIGEMGMEYFVLYYLRNIGSWLCQFDFNIYETKIKTVPTKNASDFCYIGYFLVQNWWDGSFYSFL